VAFWALYVQLQASGWLPCKQLLWLLPPWATSWWYGDNSRFQFQNVLWAHHRANMGQKGTRRRRSPFWFCSLSIVMLICSWPIVPAWTVVGTRCATGWLLLWLPFLVCRMQGGSSVHSHLEKKTSVDRFDVQIPQEKPHIYLNRWQVQ
jgi:hypothetical protein